MKDRMEVIAQHFYDLHQRQVFLRTNFASTQLASKVWKDLGRRDRAEYVEAFRQLLSKPEIKAILHSSLE